LNKSFISKSTIRHSTWILWVLIIAVLSFIPGNHLPEIKWKIISIDALVHFGMYFVLSILLAFAFVFKNKVNLSKLNLYLILVLVGIVFGTFVELVQGSFIYQRYFDLLDILANSIGSLVGMLIVALISRKLV